MATPIELYSSYATTISMASADTVVITDANGLAYRTTDGGETWSVPTAPTGANSTHPMITDSNRYGVSVAGTPEADLPAVCPLN